MIRALLVDDEPILLREIERSPYWGRYGVSVVATVTGGAEALAILRDTPIDVAFVDIKMPGMDGLELIRRANGLCQFVVISGYDDYPLVREAFKLGALDYMLKSDVTLGDGLESLLKSLPERLRPLPLGLDEQHMAASAARSVVTEECDRLIVLAHNAPANARAALLREIRRCVPADPIADVNADAYQLVLCAAPAGLAEAHRTRIRDELNRLLAALAGRVVAGLSPVGALDRAVSLQRAAVRALANAYYLPKNGVSECYAENRATPVASEDALETLREMHERFEFPKARAYALRLLDERAEACPSREHMIAFALQLCDQAESQYNALQIAEPFEGGEALRLRLLDASAYAALRAEIDGHLERLYRSFQPESDAIRLIPIYLEHNFQREIGLREIALFAGRSESTVSRQFLGETGVHFTEYLNSLRLNHAMRLLRSSALPVSAVAEASGFANVEHFGRLFRKHTGMTPSRYRESRPNSGDSAR